MSEGFGRAEVVGGRSDQSVSILYFPEQGNEIILISASSGLEKAMCAMGLHRKTGKWRDDLVIIQHQLRDGKPDIRFYVPRHWPGEFGYIDAIIVDRPEAHAP